MEIGGRGGEGKEVKRRLLGSTRFFQEQGKPLVIFE